MPVKKTHAFKPTWRLRGWQHETQGESHYWTYCIGPNQGMLRVSLDPPQAGDDPKVGRYYWSTFATGQPTGEGNCRTLEQAKRKALDHVLEALERDLRAARRMHTRLLKARDKVLTKEVKC